MNHMHRYQAPTMLMFLGLALLLTGGCVSRDRHVFESTEARPTSVALVDALDHETLWSMDIPPEHRLTMQLNRSGEASVASVSGRPATSMDWTLYQVGHHVFGEDGRRLVSGDSLKLEGRPVRIQVDYHPPAQRELVAEEADTEDEMDAQPAEPSEVEQPEQPAEETDAENPAL